MASILLISSTSAWAAITHPYTGVSFGPAGTGSGSFSRPAGVAVDQTTGDVFAFDAGEGGRIYKFDAAGEPVDFSASGTNVIESVGSAGAAEEEIAVDGSSGPDKGDLYVANGHAVRIYDESGAFLGELGELGGTEVCGVAVDPAGAVYVGIYPETVRRFLPTSNPVTKTDETGFMSGLHGICNIAADAEGSVYAASWSGGVTKYDALQFGSLSASGTTVEGSGRTLAVDPAGSNVFVDEQAQIAQYDGSVEPPALLGTMGASGSGALSESFGVSVDHASDEVYVSNEGRVEIFGSSVSVASATTEVATGLSISAARLNGSVEPAGGEITSCVFEYGTEAGHLTQSVPCEPAPPYAGSSPVAVSASLAGLSAATTYQYRILASGTSGILAGQEVPFTTRGPAIANERAVEVQSAGASLRAEIDPRGEATTYHVEYGTTSAYGTSTPARELTVGHASVSVAEQITGLAEGTPYHFRFVAENGAGVVDGPDIVFATYTRNSGLPDGRGYEMVTPEDDSGYVYSPFADDGPGVGLLGLVTKTPFQASPDGSAVVYVADPTADSGSGAIGVYEGNDYLARRSAAGEWTRANVQPNGVHNAIYYSFSEDLSKGILQSTVALSPDAPSVYNDLYVRNLASSEDQPLFTGTPPHRTPTEFGAAFGGREVALLGEFYAGASADLSRQLFAANDALTPDAIDGGETENNLYESTSGKLRLVNVLPDGSTEPNATFGSGPLGHFNPPGVSNAISADGSRIFWTDLNTGDLYVREDGTRTLQVDASQGPGVSGGGFYWAASSDGSKVLFTDCSRLTADSTAVPSGGCGSVDSTSGLTGNDLYEYEVPSGRLRDLTLDVNASDADGADVQGVAGVSRDGDYVYFVARGMLAAGATPGQPNVYLRHGEVTTFLTTLGVNEATDGGAGKTAYGHGIFDDIQPNQGYRTAVTTPDGHSLAFMSKRSLTGYPNGGLYEVYVYDADTGTLSCASCNPTGEPPSLPGVPDSGAGSFANLLPVSWSGVRQPRVISADGSRVFFDSTEPLVARDTNGMLDAYEWERDGSGSCHTSGGCVYLLSGGASPRYSFVLDASTSGNDVFIVTSAQLLAQDRGEGFDVYDARVGATSVLPPSCTGTGCQGLPSAPPTFATPASVTYAGTGNFPPSGNTAAKPKPKKAKAKHRKRKTAKRKKSHGKSKPTGKGKHPGKSAGGARKSNGMGGRR